MFYFQIIEASLWIFLAKALTFLTKDRFVQGSVLLGLALFRWKRLGPREKRPVKLVSLWPIMFLLISAITQGLLAEETFSHLGPVLKTPFYEEVLYRYILLKVFSDGHNFFSQFLVPSLLFAFAHRHYGISFDLALCFMSGIALSVRMRRSDRLVETFVIHALHNLHAVSASSKNETLFPLCFYAAMLLTDWFF